MDIKAIIEAIANHNNINYEEAEQKFDHWWNTNKSTIEDIEIATKKLKELHDEEN